MRFRALLVAGVVALFVFGAVDAAHATFPGKNGGIAFVRAGDIWTMSADGTNQTQLTDQPAEVPDNNPSWSADDRRIAFDRDVCVDTECCGGAGHCWELRSMANDGTDVRLHGNGSLNYAPAWSPAGDFFAYSSSFGLIGTYDFAHEQYGWSFPEPPTFYTLPDWSPDGADIAWCEFDGGSGRWIDVGNIASLSVVRVLSFSNGSGLLGCGGPTWSPDNQKLAFTGPSGVETVNRDGTNRVLLTAGEDPVWSPDGTKIAFTRSGNLWVMNTDGTSQVQIASSVSRPAWGAVPITGYPRPKAATPMYLPLVPAYAACGSPNRQHAAPLSHPSCAPPQQASGQLTVGTPDANMRSANSTGSVRMRVINDDLSTPADEADVTLDVSVTDVRKQSDLSDYTGELRVDATVRATDKLNRPSPTPSGLGAATVRDIGFGPPVPCSATTDPAIGSTCSLSTTVDALIPGLVVGFGRSIWEFTQMRVFDGGPDGDGDTAADNTLFMTQGVFVP